MLLDKWDPFRSDWNRRYIPYRGLGYSAIIHELGLVLIVTFIAVGPFSHVSLQTPGEMVRESAIEYLPPVGGGSSGQHAGLSGSEGAGESRSSTRAAGQAFKGPQFIRSAPPNPDNNLQTILQPELKNPPNIPVPIQVPSSIRVARAKQRDLQAPEIRMRVSLKNAPIAIPTVRPVLRTEPQVISSPVTGTIEPRLPLPLLAAEKPATRAVEPVPQEPIVVAREQQKNHVSSPPPIFAPVGGDADQTLAVINAIQNNARPTLVPAGEKRGAFEVSPDGTAGAPPRTPGVPGGSGSGVAVVARNAKGGGAGIGNGQGLGPSGSGGGVRGNGPGAGSTGAGPGNGTGGPGTGSAGTGGNGRSGTGPGNGPGSGSGPGNGNGNGNGNGSGPFSGIEIVGGVGGGKPDPLMISRGDARERRVGTAYGLTITGSAGSGGLKDLGVFRNETVYTVYIDVADVGGGPNAWTLQYAVAVTPPSSRATTVSLDGPPQPQALIEPPYPISKRIPAPAATDGTHTGVVVVNAIISKEGKMERIRAIQVPEADRGRSVISALGEWVFSPAKRGGEPVAVKVLIGVPVWW